jgi:hypothetical protein
MGALTAQKKKNRKKRRVEYTIKLLMVEVIQN